MTTPTDAQVEAAMMRKPDRCPTCDCNWLVSTPAVIDGGNGLIRCVNCKAVYGPFEPLTAAFSRAPAGTVKPLEWGPYPVKELQSDKVAVAPVHIFRHQYQVQRDPWAPTYIAYLHPTTGSTTLWWESKGHVSLDEAKAAAQADYEQRVLSALLPPQPSADLPGNVYTVDEAAFDELEAALDNPARPTPSIVAAAALMREMYPPNSADLPGNSAGLIKELADLLLSGTISHRSSANHGSLVEIDLEDRKQSQRLADLLFEIPNAAVLVSQPQPEGEAIGCIDRFQQKYASGATHMLSSLIAKGWTPVYLHPAPHNEGLIELVRELLTTVHQPQPETKPGYWHVTASRHESFGKILSDLAALTSMDRRV